MKFAVRSEDSSQNFCCELSLLRTANFFLEVQFQPELHLTRRIKLARDASESLTLNVRIRCAEDNSVEHIEHFPAEIQSHRFGETKGFLQ